MFLNTSKTCSYSVHDPFLRGIAKSTFEMTNFQLQPLLKHSLPSINSGPPDSIPKEKMFNFTGNLVFMYPNGTCEKWKNFKGGCHYLRHKGCSAIVCINKNSVACICPDIKHYESISFASIPANLL